MHRRFTGSVTATVVLALAASGYAVPFDSDDFIVSALSGDFLSVYDHDFTYKGRLGNAVSVVTGLDFNAAGQLVALSSFTAPGVREFIVFEPNGLPSDDFPSFVPATPGGLEVKVAPNGNYYVASQDDLFEEPNGLLEMTPLGEVVRMLDEGDYESVAVWPDGTIWGGGSGSSSGPVGFLKNFDDPSEIEINYYTGRSLRGGSPPPPPGTQPFDGGQRAANGMFYSDLSDTVLVVDDVTDDVFERARDGSFIRRFETNFGSTRINVRGVTRGPGGDVFVTGANAVAHFTATGEFIRNYQLSPEIGTAISIVWAGNAPGVFTAPGDFNGDGVVGQSDLDLVLLNWGDDKVPAGWVDRALFDGQLSQNELDLVLLNWGSQTPPDPAVIPEPAAAAILACLLPTALLHRRCREA